MSRTPWLGRSTGRHAAPGRGRAKATRSQKPPEPEAPGTPADDARARPATTDAWLGEIERAEATGAQSTGGAGQWSAWRPDEARPEQTPPWALAADGGVLGAPTLEDATPDAAAPVTSPVTDAARAASAATAATLPVDVPPGDEPVVTIDALGRKCPIPIIMLAEQIRDVPVGAVIAVLADDPAAYSDIPAWCGLKSHDCVFRAGYAPGGWSFGVRRRY